MWAHRGRRPHHRAGAPHAPQTSRHAGGHRTLLTARSAPDPRLLGPRLLRRSGARPGSRRTQQPGDHRALRPQARRGQKQRRRVRAHPVHRTARRLKAPEHPHHDQPQQKCQPARRLTRAGYTLAPSAGSSRADRVSEQDGSIALAELAPAHGLDACAFGLSLLAQLAASRSGTPRPKRSLNPPDLSDAAADAWRNARDALPFTS